MKDRNTLLHDAEAALSSILELELLQDVVGVLTGVVNEYEVSERCTSVVPADDENEKLLQKYAACLYVDGRSHKTIEQYLYRLRDFYKRMHINYRDVGVYDIRMYIGLLKQSGNSNSTLEGVRTYFSAFYKWMSTEGIVTKNPCDLLKPIKCKDIEQHPFSDLDIDKIRDSCKDLRERALIEMLISTGIRVSELEEMNIEDIDFDTGAVHVKHGKGDKERVTYSTPVSLYHVKRYLETRKDNSDALFVSKLGRLHPGGIRFILKEIEDRCGVEDIHPHRFRRTFATMLNRNGMPIQHIQVLLGHTKLDTTMIYIATDKEAIQHEYVQYMRV